VLAGETLLRPTRRYTLTYVDGSRVNVDAEGKWPASNCLGFMTTVAVFGTPRHVLPRRLLLGRWCWWGATGRCGNGARLSTLDACSGSVPEVVASSR